MQKYSFLVLFLLFFGSCDKENPDAIPLVPVDIYINILEPQFFNLSGVGGWEYITGGSRGIVVFRRDIDIFMAFDRHTPLNPSESCAILDVDSTNTFLVDRCSGSRYLLFDGSIVDGKATTPLTSYRTFLNGNVLRIYNF